MREIREREQKKAGKKRTKRGEENQREIMHQTRGERCNRQAE
jgi:hypothetical protein